MVELPLLAQLGQTAEDPPSTIRRRAVNVAMQHEAAQMANVAEKSGLFGARFDAKGGLSSSYSGLRPSPRRSW
ncbi:MAG TPA: hypothetical protein VJS38_07560 [Phenylobacterium sp.]|uniref:hypothetical protein n=1 Tax=Phenylobacterium sp. TaxID=1871053 RepID=UPI002B4A496D|nr:hypothetical protein [Phenylobacterium sp.]HKR88017.1 hypothetical protein [Phenylobacterium sp.]